MGEFIEKNNSGALLKLNLFYLSRFEPAAYKSISNLNAYMDFSLERQSL